MTVYLSPIGGAGAQFFDNNGNVLSGGKLYTYLAGTTTPQATYTTNIGNVFHANPIILDSAGRIPSGGEIWLADLLAYKFVLKNSNDVLIATWDNLTGIGSLIGTATQPALTPAIYNATGNGAVVAFTLPTAPTNENTTDIYINGVYQQKNTYSVTDVIVTFSEAPPINSKIEISYL